MRRFGCARGALNFSPTTRIAPIGPMFFANQGSGLFSDKTNWFRNSAATIPAGRTPLNGDRVTIIGAAFTDIVPTLSLSSFVGDCGVNQTSNLIVQNTLTVTGGSYSGTTGQLTNVTFTDATLTGFVDTNCSFGGGSGGASNAIISGDITCDGTVEIDTTSVGGYGYFSGNSVWGAGGSIGNICYFSGSSINNGPCPEGASFGENSVNYSTGIQIFCDFRDSSQNYADDFLVDCLFTDNSINHGYFSSSHLTFNGSAENLGTVYSASFEENAFNSAYADGCSFSSSAYNDVGGTLTGDNTFTGSANNYGAASGTLSFSGSAQNRAFVDAICTFYEIASNSNSAYINNAAYFYDTSSNDSGSYVDNGIWYDSTVNSGSGGYLIFRYNSINFGTANQSDFDIGAGNASTGIVTTFSTFSNSAYNGGLVMDHSNFFDNADHSLDAIANSDVDFYGDARQNGTIQGTATFNDNSQQNVPSNCLGPVVCSTTGACTPQ